MREFHVMLLALYLVYGRYSKTCSHFAKWQSWKQTPDSVTSKSPPFSGNPLPPKDWWLLPWLSSGPKIWPQECPCVNMSQE